MLVLVIVFYTCLLEKSIKGSLFDFSNSILVLQSYCHHNKNVNLPMWAKWPCQDLSFMAKLTGLVKDRPSRHKKERKRSESARRNAASMRPRSDR